MASKAYRAAATIQIAARFRGNLQWICPKCGKMLSGSRQKIDWRRPVAFCTACRTGFDVGLAFRPVEASLELVPGWFSTIQRGWTANCRANLPPGIPFLGRLVGKVWWICGCRQLRDAKVDWKVNRVECSACSQVFSVGLILYPRPRGAFNRGRAPLDWALPIWQT